MKREKLVSEMSIGELEDLLIELIDRIYSRLPSYPSPSVPQPVQPVWYGPPPTYPAYEVWCDTKTTEIKRKEATING